MSVGIYTKKYIFGTGRIFLLSILLSACASQLHSPARDHVLKIYPAPPDTTRIQYLTSISTSTDITGKRSAFMEYVLGEEQQQAINKPYGITSRPGKIYICDTMLGGLEIIDLKNSGFEFFQPEGLGKLRKPINCFVDANGMLYVADAERNQIVIFSQNGNYLAAFGIGEEGRPTDVAVQGEYIYVADIRNHSIAVIDKDSRKVIRRLPELEEGEEGFLNQPSNLFIRGHRIYVSDFGDFKIKIYDLEGNYLSSIGSYGRQTGQFVRPKGIAVDEQNHLYVVDAGFENVQIFNPNGELMLYFGGAYKTPGDMWLPAKVAVDYENTAYFQNYVNSAFDLHYLIYVTNQYGPDKVNVYGFVSPKK